MSIDFKEGAPVDILRTLAHGIDPCWRSGYKFVRWDNADRLSCLVEGSAGIFKGAQFRMSASNVRPSSDVVDMAKSLEMLNDAKALIGAVHRSIVVSVLNASEENVTAYAAANRSVVDAYRAVRDTLVNLERAKTHIESASKE